MRPDPTFAFLKTIDPPEKTVFKNATLRVYISPTKIDLHNPLGKSVEDLTKSYLASFHFCSLCGRGPGFGPPPSLTWGFEGKCEGKNDDAHMGHQEECSPNDRRNIS